MKPSVGGAILGALRWYVLGFVVWGLLVDLLGIYDDLGRSSWQAGARGVGVLCAYFVIVAMLRMLWPTRLGLRTPWKLISGGKTYGIFSFSGVANNVTKQQITEVTAHSHVEPTYSVYSAPYRNTVTLTTTSRTRDQFFLAGGDGSHSSFQVDGMDLAIGNGQIYSVAWTVGPFKGFKRYVVFVNHLTARARYPVRDLRALARGTGPGRFVLLLFASSGLLALGGYLWALWIFPVGLIASEVIIRIQVRVFTATGSRRLLRALNDVAATIRRPAGTAPSAPAPTTAAVTPTSPTVPAQMPMSPPVPSMMPTSPPVPATMPMSPPVAGPPVFSLGALPPAAPSTPPTWLPDPSSRHQLRYWNGQGWTGHVSDAGAMSLDG